MTRRPAALALVALLALAGCGKPTPVAPAAQPRAAAAAQAQGIFNQPVVAASWVNEQMARYDHNGNGAIDLQRTGWFAQDERERRETVRTQVYDQQGHLIRIRYTTYTYTLRDLFYAADHDADQVVTREELLHMLAKFDTNGDGELTRRSLWGLITFKPKGEYDRFRDAYGEHTSDVDQREIPVADRAGQVAIEHEAPVVTAPTGEDEVEAAAQAEAQAE